MIRPSHAFLGLALGAYLAGGAALISHLNSRLDCAETSRLTAIGNYVKDYRGANVNTQLEGVRDNLSVLNSNKNLPKLTQLEKEIESISKDLTTNNSQIYQPVLNKIGDDIKNVASSEGTDGFRPIGAGLLGIIGTILGGIGLKSSRDKYTDVWNY